MNRRPSCLSALAAFVVLMAVSSVEAQLIRAPLDQGFVRTSSISVTVDEMLGAQKVRAADQPIVGPGYPALWISEVQYKPVRFVRMEVTDPATGEKKRELVWYMIYRSIFRDYTELAGENQADLLLKLEDPDLQPSNDIESAASLPLQIPRFVLETNDSGPAKTYSDEVNQQIRQSIYEREFKSRAPGTELRSSIGAIVEVDQDNWVSVDDANPLQKAVYGVAIWRGVDQTTDYFTIHMHGFSNAYRITPEGVVERKVIEQKFGRPGDEFNQDEAEFRVLGDPVWKYVPTNSTIDVPDYAKILRK